MWVRNSFFLHDMMQNAVSAVKKGLLHMFSANMLNQFLGFGSLLIVTKILQPSEVGALKIIQSYVAVCLTLATFGFPSAIIKFCAEIKDTRLCKYILKRSVTISVFVSILICVGVWGLNARGNLSDDFFVIKWLPWYIWLIIPNSAYILCLTYMQAIKDFKRMAGLQSALKCISVFAVIIATYFAGIGGYVVAIVFMMFVSMAVVLKQSDMSLNIGVKLEIPSGFWFLTKVSIFSSVLGTLCLYVDMFFLDYFIVDRDMIGYYAMSTMFIMVGTQFVGTVQNFLTPYFAEKSSDKIYLWEMMLKYQSFLSLAMLMICPFIYMTAYLLIEFYYGWQYGTVLMFLSIMLVQLWLHTAYAIVGCTLLSINKEQCNVIVATFFLLIKIILSYWFINKYGMIGFVFAQAFAEIPAIILAYMIVKSELKNDSFK